MTRGEILKSIPMLSRKEDGLDFRGERLSVEIAGIEMPVTVSENAVLGLLPGHRRLGYLFPDNHHFRSLLPPEPDVPGWQKKEGLEYADPPRRVSWWGEEIVIRFDPPVRVVVKLGGFPVWESLEFTRVNIWTRIRASRRSEFGEAQASWKEIARFIEPEESPRFPDDLRRKCPGLIRLWQRKNRGGKR